MREPSIDPERLAALLDGRLSERERDDLLAEIAASEDDRELLGDAAAVLRELEMAGVGGVAATGVPPARPTLPPAAPVPPAVTPPPQSRPKFPPWAALAAAASILVAAGVWYQTRGGGNGALADPAMLVAALERSPTPGDDTLATVAWSTTRGAGDATADRARAVRFGAQATALVMTARTGDSAGLTRVARSVAALLEPVPASGPAVQAYREVGAAAGTPAAARRAADAWEAASPLVGADAAALGAWLAAARVATARRDESFFRTRPSRRAGAALAALEGLDASIRAAADRVGAATAIDAAPNWATLNADLEAVLRALGS